VIDRLPPQSIEAEQSVLGSILIDRDAVIEVAEFLKPEDFYRQAHAKVYAVMLDLFERREPIDIVTVAEALERDEDLESIGGRAYLGTLSNATPTAVHATQYARIVERKAVLRNLIGAAGRIASIAYEDPAEISEAVDRAEAELFAVSQKRIDAGFSPRQIRSRLASIGRTPESLTGILVTHEHGDHILGLAALSEACHIPVYCNRPTLEAISSGRSASISQSASRAISAGSGWAAEGTLRGSTCLSLSTGADSGSRGSIRYTGPRGSAIAASTARATTRPAWPGLRSS
jgi:hypothetical protein